MGSTIDPCKRWSSAKHACSNRNASNTRLYSHFESGCTTHLDTGNLEHLTVTLLDSMTTSEEKLRDAGHTGGVQCRCTECGKLLDLNRSIEIVDRTSGFAGLDLSTPQCPNGLNSRDEIKSRSRANFQPTNS